MTAQADRFLVLVPLCAAVIALSSLAWHSEPPNGRGAAARYLRADAQARAAAEGAWDHNGRDGGDWPEELAWTGPRAARPSSTPPGAEEAAETGSCSETSPARGAGDHIVQSDLSSAARGAESSAGAGGFAEYGRDEHSDEEDGDEETDNDRVRMCAAAAAEQVQCVLNSGGGASGECSTSKISACLARLEIARAGPKAATVLVQTKYGRMVVPLADSFEGLALLMYGEWMEWGLMVLENLITKGGVTTILDVNPGTGGATLALSKMIGSKGRLLVSEPRPLLMQSLAASAQLAGLKVTFLPCLWSHGGVREMLHLNATRATGLGKVEGADALRAHGRFPSACTTVDEELAGDPAGIDLIRISTCALHPWRQVLQGALASIRARLPILYIESRARGDAALEVEAFLVGESGLDYKCFWSAGRMFRAGNWRGVATNIYDDALSVFYQLCVPPRIQLHGLRPVSADLHHKHKQVALTDVLFSSFGIFDLAFLRVSSTADRTRAHPLARLERRLIDWHLLCQLQSDSSGDSCRKGAPEVPQGVPLTHAHARARQRRVTRQDALRSRMPPPTRPPGLALHACFRDLYPAAWHLQHLTYACS